MVLLEMTTIRHRRNASTTHCNRRGVTMNGSIRAKIRHILQSPTGGIVVTAVILAAALPVLADRRHHIPPTA
jgi:hypothetical protein